MCIGPHVKYPLYLSDFNGTWILAINFRKILKTSNLIKICPVGAELFHADRQTNMTKLIFRFCNFANVPSQFLHEDLFNTRALTVAFAPLDRRDTANTPSCCCKFLFAGSDRVRARTNTAVCVIRVAFA
jgi:hypothetical protein